jgi:hypothetical protein
MWSQYENTDLAHARVMLEGRHCPRCPRSDMQGLRAQTGKQSCQGPGSTNCISVPMQAPDGHSPS